MSKNDQNNALATTGSGLEIWNNEKADKIRQLFAPDLTNDEFGFFWGLGKSLGANPFAGEIWAVKYDKKKPAQVFLGRDFYRKKAQEQADYDGHIVDAVYENDTFKVETGVPKHSYTLKERGKLTGAYCIVHKKGISHSFYVYVEIDEYHKGQSTWNDKPATMIKKVAEAQALRGAYQGIFRATYDESERWDEDGGAKITQPEDREVIDIEVEESKESASDSGKDNLDDLKAEINKLGKMAYGGTQWFSESKKLARKHDEGAETILDLDEEGLEALKADLEFQLEDQ